MFIVKVNVHPWVMNSCDMNIMNCTKKKEDYTNLYTSCVTNFSSNWNNASNTGTFHLNVNNTSSNSNANITAHLKFSISMLFKTLVLLNWGF